MALILLHTPRLSITHFEEKDLAAFHDMESDPEVMKYTSTGKPHDYESNNLRLKALIQAYESPNGDLEVYAVREVTENALVGSVALERNNQGRYEIGYRLRRKYWGLGYGQEMADHWIAHLFLERRLPALEAYAFVDNVASVRILERSALLFQHEFFNESYNLWDRYYALSLEAFLNMNQD